MKKICSSRLNFSLEVCVEMRLFVYALQEDPVIIKRKIDLKYKVFGKKRSEDSTMKAGSLIVSAVFQPIESVSKSGEVTTQS